MKSTKILSLPLVLLLGLVLYACNSLMPEPEKQSANEIVYEKFKDWYLWYEQIPELDPNSFDSLDELVDSLKIPEDRWSIATSLTRIKKLLEGGKYTGFGGGFVIDSDKKIRVSHVYKNSPLGREGVDRAWELVEADGFNSSQVDEINNVLSDRENVNFSFLDTAGILHSFSATREEITMNTVLYSSVIEKEGSKIGYIVFDGFLETSGKELDSVFNYFFDENVNELIVDFRYNGGGLNVIAYKLIGIIGGDKVKGQVISHLRHNKKHTKNDSSQKSDHEGVKLSLERVFFITTEGTASASELVINSLVSYMDVTMVGTKTHGKPVGMYVFEDKEHDLAILPICFKTTNVNGYGDYMNGLETDIHASDDLTHGWGNMEENMLKTTLSAILSPAVAISSATPKSASVDFSRQMEYKGFYKLVGAY
jgi:carboxyl-terminal processing protease